MGLGVVSACVVIVLSLFFVPMVSIVLFYHTCCFLATLCAILSLGVSISPDEKCSIAPMEIHSKIGRGSRIELGSSFGSLTGILTTVTMQYRISIQRVGWFSREGVV